MSHRNGCFPIFARISSVVVAGILFVAFGGVLQVAAQTPEENKALILYDIEEVWNKGNLDVADEVIAADYVHYVASLPEVRGPEGYKQMVAMYRIAFPDLHVTVDDMIAEGDEVAARWICTGTHQGELMGMPPTGNQAVWTGITMYRFADGKIVELWWAWDALCLMQQIGVIPPLGPTAVESRTWGQIKSLFEWR